MKDKTEFEETHSKFKTRLLGIYYDDPSNLVNRSKMRAVIGFYLDEPNEEIETYFKNKGYKRAELPTVPTITGQMEDKCGLSHMLAPLKFYKSLAYHIKENKSKYSGKADFSKGIGPSFEVYEDKTMKYYWPFEEQEKFQLSEHPQPDLKDSMIFLNS